MELEPKTKDLSIIIVNWNTRELLKNCLDSVFNAVDDLAIEIWVVDNGSKDGSVTLIKERYPTVKLIENPNNLGFSAANNQALARAAGRYSLLLNSDTEVQAGALTHLVEKMDSEPDLGAVGPQLLNPDGSIQPSHGIFLSFWSEFIFQTFLFKVFPTPYVIGQRVKLTQLHTYQTEHYVDWVSGAALMMRTALAQDKGVMLDEGIFMYAEDVDLCYRIKAQGYQIKFCPQAKVIHLVSASSHRNYENWIERYTRGNLTFLAKHRSDLTLRTSCILIMFGSLLRIFLWRIVPVLKRSRTVEAIQRRKGYANAFCLAFNTLRGGRNALQS